ncbi:MAG TPA: hypothetical protein VKA06_12260 [Spirochaetia bacterium]|nr:hypothetical protein [Spirochaetia bacterium]
MRNRMVLFALILVVAGSAVALDDAAVARADELYEEDRTSESIDALEAALATAQNGAERAEVLWRLSRATLAIGEALEDDSADADLVLETYERGERYGIQAVEADPDSHLGYYWQSANIGKWGQAKGILNALFKATPMRNLLQQAINRQPDHAGSYYVLGQLYAEVPGVISFGNDDYAVGLARKSIDLHEAELASGEADEVEHDYYIQLASHLMQRGWNERRRDREMAGKRDSFQAVSDRLEQGWYYEGTVQISAQDDVEEAEALLRDMIGRLESIRNRSDGQERQLERARGLTDEL